VFWFDPRFAIGIGLVIAAVIGVVSLVAAADETVPVVSARETLSPGERVTSADLVTRDVRIPGAEALYLAPSDIPADGIVITRPVGAGELVPAASAGDVDGLEVTSMVLSLATRLPSSVDAGARVDVWAARSGADGSFAAPTVLVSSALVISVVKDEGLMADDARSALEVLLPRDATARVLEAVANDAAISAVPVDLPLGG
jgi:hypothetical protein